MDVIQLFATKEMKSKMMAVGKVSIHVNFVFILFVFFYVCLSVCIARLFFHDEK